jgi:hypothetical protein
MPYLFSRQQTHNEPHLRRSAKSHGVALTAALLLICAAAVLYCGIPLFEMVKAV